MTLGIKRVAHEKVCRLRFRYSNVKNVCSPPFAEPPPVTSLTSVVSKAVPVILIHPLCNWQFQLVGFFRVRSDLAHRGDRCAVPVMTGQLHHSRENREYYP